MQRTISAMVGKGSVNHNSRKFKAENVDADRSHLNIDYCNESIKKVYHELFDEALERYNAKQTRTDRKIANYYEIPDGGEIIMQKAVAVHEGDTPETLQKRVMRLAEWKILPEAVEKVCRDMKEKC